MISVTKYRGINAIFSLSWIVIFLCCAGYKWYTKGEVFVYSIDFTGGTQVLFKFDKPVNTAQLKDALHAKGWEGVVTRDFSPTEVLVRVKEFSNDVKGLAGRLQQTLQEGMPGSTITIEQSEAVGPGVGESLRWKSIWAILYGLAAMLLYIAFRFWSFGFAVGAVVALFHDIPAILAVFFFLNREISINVIGMMLAVLGYSINDTIVVFSYIRDNIKKMGQLPLAQIVDISVVQTLRRTVLTSFATLLTVICMLVLGGEALRDMSLALLVGIIVGTYSSIFIASPVMMLLYNKDK
jgi:preprotein translocase SecF subunit